MVNENVTGLVDFIAPVARVSFPFIDAVQAIDVAELEERLTVEGNFIAIVLD